MSTRTPRLLLTNDDGIDAPGLAALAEAARVVGLPRIVAPAGAWSSRGHAVTTGESFSWEDRGGSGVAVEGTPADCVRIGLHLLTPGVDWVLAGINSGGNLGADIHHSGTVAAAREAVLHGVPAVAFSHYIRRGIPLDWRVAAERAARVLALLLTRPRVPGTLWNVNLPHLGPGSPDPQIVFCPVDPSPLPLAFEVDGHRARYSGDYHGRAREPGHDVEVCFSGRIAVSLLPILAPYPGHEPEAGATQ